MEDNKARKKRILIVDAFIGMGGEEEVAFYIYKNLDRSVFDVRIMAPRESRYFDKYRPDENEFIPNVVTGKFSFRNMLQVRKLIKENGIDLVHVHGYSAGYFMRLACVGMPSVKIVWSMHLNVLDVQAMSIVSRWINAKIENILSNHRIFTDRIICVAEDGKKCLLQRGVNRTDISVIYNGIDTSIFEKTEEKPESDVFTLGFISRLSVQKNIPLLMEITKTLLENGMSLKLIVAGEGEMYQYASSFVATNHLEDHISLIGFQKDVASILKKIDVLILPSLYECFPMIILESLSCSVPVIGSRVNGVPEAIIDGETGCLVDSGDLDGFVQAVKKYYNDRCIIKHQGKNGRNLVKERFSKEIMLEKHERLYKEMLML